MERRVQVLAERNSGMPRLLRHVIGGVHPRFRFVVPGWILLRVFSHFQYLLIYLGKCRSSFQNEPSGGQIKPTFPLPS
jgi:hypothetical protein